ncbi:MAG TPA: SIMPL domain-containing protein [Candidatus Baltobacteraceae bacterium]|nr:SIMPL domain-containing protein [Candidatus Baltobacteraceae bacterium]
MTRLFIFLALLAMLGAPVAAAQPCEITVTAQGSASTMPDMARASFTISTAAGTAAAATSENNSRYDRLLSGLRALGIAPSDIRTTSLSLSYNPPPKPPDAPQPGQRYGYFVYRGLEVTVHRLALVGKVVDAAVAAGVTDVNSVSFDTSDQRGQFARALRDGVEQARAHADAMAAAAGLRITRVKTMQEGVPSRIVPAMQGQVFRSAAPVPTQIEPSAVQTQTTVTVTYVAQ